MRKIMTLVTVTAMVLMSFVTISGSIASDGCGCEPITKTPYPYCTWFELDEIPLGWDAWVKITIRVHNYDDEDTMTDVMVKDRFGAEWEVEAVTHCSTTNWPVFTTKGESEKVFMEWDIGTLGPNEHAYVVIWISTDENPAGKQEYTSTGIYELNSGATLKYKIDGKQYSFCTGSIMVEVLDIDPPQIPNYPPDFE